MAQQVISTGNIERLVSFAGGMAAAGWPDALEKLEAPQTVDEYGALIGTPPRMIRSDEDVAKRAAAKAQQEQMAANLQMGQQAVDIAKTASETKLEDSNLAEQTIKRVGGEIT